MGGPCVGGLCHGALGEGPWTGRPCIEESLHWGVPQFGDTCVGGIPAWGLSMHWGGCPSIGGGPCTGDPYIGGVPALGGYLQWGVLCIGVFPALGESLCFGGPCIGGSLHWGACALGGTRTRVVPALGGCEWPPQQVLMPRVPPDVAGGAGSPLQDAERADRPVPAAQPGAGLHPPLPRREGQGQGPCRGQGLLRYGGVTAGVLGPSIPGGNLALTPPHGPVADGEDEKPPLPPRSGSTSVSSNSGGLSPTGLGPEGGAER